MVFPPCPTDSIFAESSLAGPIAIMSDPPPLCEVTPLSAARDEVGRPKGWCREDEDRVDPRTL
jgi:hypothetical protein